MDVFRRLAGFVSGSVWSDDPGERQDEHDMAIMASDGPGLPLTNTQIHVFQEST